MSAERDLLQRIYNFMTDSKMVVITAHGYKNKTDILKEHTQLMEEMELALKPRGKKDERVKTN